MSTHRVYMSFMHRGGWYCQFLEADLKTPLRRRLAFKDRAKLYELAERGGYRMTLEGRQVIEHAIETGRGGIWLELSEETAQAIVVASAEIFRGVTGTAQRISMTYQ
jgi:hypothetical protein